MGPKLVVESQAAESQGPCCCGLSSILLFLLCGVVVMMVLSCVCDLVFDKVSQNIYS